MGDPLRILIVEDSLVAAFMMEAQIHRKEPCFAVCIARTLKEACRIWREFKPHIVVMDLHLPDAGPEEILANLKDFDPSCILATSGDSTLEESARLAGACDFMPKFIGETADPFIKRLKDLAPECSQRF